MSKTKGYDSGLVRTRHAAIVVEDEDKLPSRIPNSIFNDTLSSSEHSREASRSSSPSVSMQLRHVDRNLSPSPEPVFQACWYSSTIEEFFWV